MKRKSTSPENFTGKRGKDREELLHYSVQCSCFVLSRLRCYSELEKRKERKREGIDIRWILWISLLSLASLSVLLLLYTLWLPPGSPFYSATFWVSFLLLSLAIFETLKWSFSVGTSFGFWLDFVCVYEFTGVIVRIVLLLRVVTWISHSPQGRWKLYRFFGIVRFAFLLGSFGCFLDPMDVENLPSWRYTQNLTMPTSIVCDCGVLYLSVFTLNFLSFLLWYSYRLKGLKAPKGLLS